ncbi:uncharacterized protein LOC130654510 [Hydractinia symbiolongicarpus]|uniref:uncharacterized protein LOC130654510 n=1 Tax=Hydractinia symbiolongicarpus TaxID=13093 RepID=UPI00254F1839|nr:uncharacterized protein LOC130654510 [Hydractinia symbiolongicarpus]
MLGTYQKVLSICKHVYGDLIGKDKDALAEKIRIDEAIDDIVAVPDTLRNGIESIIKQRKDISKACDFSLSLLHVRRTSISHCSFSPKKGADPAYLVRNILISIIDLYERFLIELTEQSKNPNMIWLSCENV